MNRFSGNSGAILLAGGQSRRMGKPKALLKLGDQTMLECVLSILFQAVGRVVIVCAPNEHQTVIDDRVEYAFDEVSHQGPLQGLKAGLQALPKSVTHVFVTGCDAPFLNPDLICALLDNLNQAQVCAPEIDGVVQPIPAVYDVDVLPVLTAMLAKGERSLKALLAKVETHVLNEPMVRQVDPDLNSFVNVNTPTDYERVLRMRDLYS